MLTQPRFSWPDSAIGHAGYLLVAATAHSEIGMAAAMFRLASCVFMNVGAIGERCVQVKRPGGTLATPAVTAALFMVFLTSPIGVPHFFKAVLDSQPYWLAVLGLLNSAVSAYYYLRISAVM